MPEAPTISPDEIAPDPNTEESFPLSELDDATVETILERLDIDPRYRPQLLKEDVFRTRLAINSMFSQGGDGYEPGQIATVMSLLPTDPERAHEIREMLGIDKNHIANYVLECGLLWSYAARSDTSIETIQILGYDVAFLEALLVNEIAKIAEGKEPPGPDYLRSIGRTARLMLTGKAAEWGTRPSVYESIESMISCLEDLRLQALYPRAYQLARQAEFMATGVPSPMIYNTEAMSRHMERILIKNGYLTREDIDIGLVQVTGRFKPLYSGLTKDLRKAEDIREDIRRLADTKLEGKRSWDENEAYLKALEELLGYTDDPEIQTLIQKLENRRVKGSDQRGCRIWVQDSSHFDEITSALYGSERKLLNVLSKYDYDGQKILKEKHPLDLQKMNPADVVLGHIQETREGHLRYADVSFIIPLQIETERGEQKLMSHEIRILFGTTEIEAMHTASYTAHKNNGDYTQAGLTSEFVTMIRAAATTGAKELREINQLIMKPC